MPSSSGVTPARQVGAEVELAVQHPGNDEADDGEESDDELCPKLPKATARPSARPMMMPRGRYVSCHLTFTIGGSFTLGVGRRPLTRRWTSSAAPPARRLGYEPEPGLTGHRETPVKRGESRGERGGITASVGMGGADELAAGAPAAAGRPQALLHEARRLAGRPGVGHVGDDDIDPARARQCPHCGTDLRGHLAAGTPHRARTETTTWSSATRTPGTWRPGR